MVYLVALQIFIPGSTVILQQYTIQGKNLLYHYFADLLRVSTPFLIHRLLSGIIYLMKSRIVKLYRVSNIELKNTSYHYMTYNSYFTDTITSYMCMFTILLNLHSYDDNFSYLYPISPLHLACIFIAMSVSFMACVSVDLCVRNFYIL